SVCAPRKPCERLYLSRSACRVDGGRGVGDRDRKGEYRAAGGAICDRDSAAVCFDNAAADRQTQPDAAAGRAGGGAKKLVEHAALRASRDSRTSIGDVDC